MNTKKKFTAIVMFCALLFAFAQTPQSLAAKRDLNPSPKQLSAVRSLNKNNIKQGLLSSNSTKIIRLLPASKKIVNPRMAFDPEPSMSCNYCSCDLFTHGILCGAPLNPLCWTHLPFWCTWI